MFTIRAFCGTNGGGKSLAVMEQVVLPAWEAGLPVVSNMALRPYMVGAPDELYVPLESWRQIATAHDCVIVLDEINACLPARSFSSLPAQLGRVLNQLRKVNVRLSWTAPDFSRGDLILREVTQAVTICRGFVPDSLDRQPSERWFPKAKRDEKGRRVPAQGWAPNRLFRWSTYDARDLDEVSSSMVTKAKPKSTRWYWRSRHLAQECYDTLESVNLLDHLDDVGVCVVCNGTRSRAKCSCGGAGAPSGVPEAPRSVARARTPLRARSA